MRVAPILLVPLALGAGCPKGGLPSLDALKPTVRFADVNVQDINFERLDTEFVFDVENPNPVRIQVSSFTYDLDLAGSGFIDGTSDDGVGLEPQGTSQIKLPVGLVFTELLETAGNLRGADEIPFAIAGDFAFDTPLGEVRIPYSEEGTLPMIRAPKFRVAAARVAEFRPLANRAVLEVDIGMTSQGGAPLGIQGFDYGLALGGNNVAEGLVAELATLEPGQEQVATLPVELNLLSLGTTIVRAITNKEQIDIGLDAAMNVDTPFGLLPLSVDETGNVQLQ